MRKLAFTVVLAAVLWAVMFSPLTAPYVNFWWMMTASALTLSILSTCFNRGWWHAVRFGWGEVLAGVGIAVVLWGIYGMKEGESLWLLSLLMLVLIGPAEEIFWRGYVQRTLSARWSPDAGFVATTLVYALVHAASCNFMLVMAAAVAGVVWGGLYRLFPRRLGAVIVSHAVWDVAVFVWFPI